MNKRITLLIILLLSLSLVAKADLKIKTGSKITVVTKCIGAIDESTLDKIVSSSNKGDETILKAAVKSGFAVILPKGTNGTVLRVKVGKVRIRLSDGKMVWVLYKHVR